MVPRLVILADKLGKVAHRPMRRDWCAFFMAIIECLIDDLISSTIDTKNLQAKANSELRAIAAEVISGGTNHDEEVVLAANSVLEKTKLKQLPGVIDSLIVRLETRREVVMIIRPSAVKVTTQPLIAIFGEGKNIACPLETEEWFRRAGRDFIHG